MKSILAKHIMQCGLIVLQAYDIYNFFGKETLPDVMNTLHEVGIDDKVYMLWSKLNSNTNIRVKTDLGYSEWSQEGAMIGQGTGGEAPVSQVNLDHGVVDMHQIYKSKGRKDVLSNSRYIHSKEWLPRLSEGMVVESMKKAILN